MDASVLTIGLVLVVFPVFRISANVRMMIRGGCISMKEEEKMKKRHESDGYGNKCASCERETARSLFLDSKLLLIRNVRI